MSNLSNKAAVRAFVRQDEHSLTASGTWYSRSKSALFVAGEPIALWRSDGKLRVNRIAWANPTMRDRLRYLGRLLHFDAESLELDGARFRVLDVAEAAERSAEAA